MERLFDTHYVRTQKSLDGIWEFQTIEEEVLPKLYTDEMAVPSCFEMSVKYCRYKGLAAYRKVVYVERDGNVRFLFKGVSHSGTVFFDGEKIGFHYNAYTPFSSVVRNVEKGEHVLELIVDNHFSEMSALHVPNDYFTYGGITRPVFMEMVSDCYIERTEFEPMLKKDKWMAKVRVFVRNCTDSSQDVSIEAECAGTQIVKRFSVGFNREAEYDFEMNFNEVCEWSTKEPNLYLFKCVLKMGNTVVDDLIDRVGFRVVELKNKKLYINGKEEFLKGVNRHEDHGSVGCAIPLQIMYSDVALIKELSANAVRTSHYPNDERFLDLCDENGIMVWEEGHARGMSEKQTMAPLFAEQSMAVLRRMVQYHYNHPSIVIWGCLNECASDSEECKRIYKRHFDFLKEDKSRPNTYASCKFFNDLCFDMEDIVSYNIYPRWYNEKSPKGFAEELKSYIAGTGNADKPLIISEYGAGAIYNMHDVMHVKWSEEFQVDVLTEATADFLADSSLAGIFIWQFCDTRVTQEEWALIRPNSRNNKGLVDEYRRPKLAYYAVQKLFKEYDEEKALRSEKLL